MNEKLQRLKEEYDAVDVPLKLDEIVNKAFGQAQPPKKRPFSFKTWSGGVAAAVLLLCMGLLNAFPSLTSSVLSVPILGGFAELLTIREFKVADQNENPGDMIKLYSAPEASEPAESSPEAASSVSPAEEEAAEEELAEPKQGYRVADSGVNPVANAAGAAAWTESPPVDPWHDMAVTGEAIPYKEKVNRSKTPEEILQMTAFNQTADTEAVMEAKEQMREDSELALAALFIDDSYVARIDAVITEEITRRAQQSALNQETNVAWNFWGISADQAYHLDQTGLITIVFAPGEIAPVEAGTIEIPIPHDRIADIRIPPRL